MKSSRKKVTAVLLATAFMLAGCGEDLYVLTPEEEAAIVTYSAHTVAKYNTFQEDGEVYVMQEVLNGEETETAGTEDLEETIETDTEEVEAATDTEEPTEVSETETVTETEVTEESETAEATETSEDIPAEGPADGTDAELSGATLTEALDLGVIDAQYTGNSLCTTYQHSEYYTVDAEAGKQLLVLNVKLKNQINQALHIDILRMAPQFRATVNGTITVPAQTTILLNDLSTYQADIGANADNETVLLFQIPQDVQEISELQLEITMNGKIFTINL